MYEQLGEKNCGVEIVDRRRMDDLREELRTVYTEIWDRKISEGSDKGGLGMLEE